MGGTIATIVIIAAVCGLYLYFARGAWEDHATARDQAKAAAERGDKAGMEHHEGQSIMWLLVVGAILFIAVMMAVKMS